jgi:AcrR family transcriptional regulator
MSAQDDRRRPRLRERKRAKTRETIQHEALALFRKHGYALTTVEQICEAAEVSESTFFRYFPTKEAVVLTDELDPLMAAAFRAQPPEVGVIAALRRAFRLVAETMNAEELTDMRDRSVMILDVPELWGAALVQLTQTMQMVADLIAERLDRNADEVPVRAMAGALVGVMIAQLSTWATHPDIDVIASIDDAMAFLEKGLTIDRKTLIPVSCAIDLDTSGLERSIAKGDAAGS